MLLIYCPGIFNDNRWTGPPKSRVDVRHMTFCLATSFAPPPPPPSDDEKEDEDNDDATDQRKRRRSLQAWFLDQKQADETTRWWQCYVAHEFRVSARVIRVCSPVPAVQQIPILIPQWSTKIPASIVILLLLLLKERLQNGKSSEDRVWESEKIKSTRRWRVRVLKASFL